MALALVAFAGCMDDSDAEPVDTDGDGVTDQDEIARGTDPRQAEVIVAEPESMAFFVSTVGERAPEPSVGITSSGCIFFVALEKVMRSCDHGTNWERTDGLLVSPTSNDPYLWVDPITDRVFDVQMGPLTHTWIAWTDDDGTNWLGNPYDQGPYPVNDHIKVGSGPWTGEGLGYGSAGGLNPSYETAVYFCYNKLIGVYCYTSFDGGMTFPVGGQIIGLAGSGGLHGAITTAPDGTVYVPPRTGTPTVLFSKDNGFSWESRTMGSDVGTPDPRKNSEVGTDSASNAYHIWIGADHGVYMARSTDSGNTWDETSLRISPVEITSATFPHIDAGDPGRVAVAYLGATDYVGNPQLADEAHGSEVNATYHMYVSYSLDALAPSPTWTTIQISQDPVQIGSICLNSGACSNGNRNLLDFNDLTIDQDGRIYIAYADGCTGECAAGDHTPSKSRDALGKVAIQAGGPSLYEAVELARIGANG